MEKIHITKIDNKIFLFSKKFPVDFLYYLNKSIGAKNQMIFEQKKQKIIFPIAFFQP